MLKTSRMAREMLSVRVATYLYDRLKLYTAASRTNVQDNVEEALQEWLDKKDPLHKAADEAKAKIASSTSSSDDRIARLERQIEQMTSMLGDRSAGHERPAKAKRRA